MNTCTIKNKIVNGHLGVVSDHQQVCGPAVNNNLKVHSWALVDQIGILGHHKKCVEIGH